MIEVTTEEEFDALFDIGDGLVILFTAPTWCIPCQRFEPHWNKAAEAGTGFTFVKVDMGETPEDTGEHWATRRFGILGVPTVKRIVINDDVEFTDIKARAVVPFLKEIEA